MPRHKFRTTLLRLVEAGQLTRQALVAPLLERGLEPGDDVVLSEVAAQPGRATADLAAALALPPETLTPMLDRLVARDLIGEHDAGIALTERGTRLHAALAATAAEFETALLAGLGEKHRKGLDRSLKALLHTLHGD